MLAVAARGPATAGPMQRLTALHLNAAAARARSRASRWVYAEAQHSGSGTSSRGNEDASKAGQAPAQPAAWWDPLMRGPRAAVRLLLEPSLPLLTPYLALAACTWLQPLAAAQLLLLSAARPMAALVSQQLAQQAQLYVEKMCRDKPAAEVIAQLRSEYAELSRRWRYQLAVLVFGACMYGMLTAAAPLVCSVAQAQPILAGAAGGLVFGFQAGPVRFAAKDAFRRWVLRDRINAAERLLANEAQRGQQQS